MCIHRPFSHPHLLTSHSRVLKLLNGGDHWGRKKRDCLTGKATSDPWRSLQKGILSLPQSSYLKLGKSFKEHSSCCSMPLFLIRDKPRQEQNSHHCKNQPMALSPKTSPPQICLRKRMKIAQATLSLIFPNFQMFCFATWGFACSKKATPQGKIAANSVTLLCQNTSRVELHIQKKISWKFWSTFSNLCLQQSNFHPPQSKRLKCLQRHCNGTT